MTLRVIQAAKSALPTTPAMDPAYKQRMAAVASHGSHAPPTSVAATTSASASAGAQPGDETIHTTANHPWLSADHGWVVAGKLTLGEPVQRVDGSVAIVVALTPVQGSAPMWDLTISEVHDFAVGSGTYVVHNCGGKVEYGSTKLSRAVRDARIDAHDDAGNFGAAKLEDGSIITGRSRGRLFHAEHDLIEQADRRGSRIVELYTEREPCGKTCARLLQRRGITKVTWSWDYRNVSVDGRRAIGAAIRDAIHAHPRW